MALEDIEGAGKYLGALNPANPASGDDRREGDNHIRGVKNTLRNTFPNLNAAVTATVDQLNDTAVPKLPLAGGTVSGSLAVQGHIAPAATQSYLQSRVDGWVFGNGDCGPGPLVQLSGTGTISATIPANTITPGNALKISVYSFSLTANIGYPPEVTIFQGNTGVPYTGPVVMSGVEVITITCISNNVFVVNEG